MDRKTVTRIAGYLTLFTMIVSAVLYFHGTQTRPCLLVLIVSSWLHGICWGYRYALEGRLTWF